MLFFVNFNEAARIFSETNIWQPTDSESEKKFPHPLRKYQNFCRVSAEILSFEFPSWGFKKKKICM